MLAMLSTLDSPGPSRANMSPILRRFAARVARAFLSLILALSLLYLSFSSDSELSPAAMEKWQVDSCCVSREGHYDVIFPQMAVEKLQQVAEHQNQLQELHLHMMMRALRAVSSVILAVHSDPLWWP